jgi:hypothetical protein
MKKLLFVLVVLGITLQGYAGIKEKHVVGTWKYKVETPEGDLTGDLLIEKKDGKLVGSVSTEDGQVIDMSNLEIRDNDVFYFEVETGYEALEVTVTIKGKTFEGTVGSEQGSMPITGEKVK